MHAIDFVDVSTEGLDSSPHAMALAGLRAHEARYFKNKFDIIFKVSAASEEPSIVDRVNRILLERDIVISSQPLEVAEVFVDDIRWSFVFYESGLAVNVKYSLTNPKDRAVGFKLSDGMEIPAELAERFKFARMKSSLAGTIRGTYFVVKGEY